MKAPSPGERSLLLLYQMRGDLLLKVALIFMLQLAALCRVSSAKVEGARPARDGEKPALKLFLDRQGVLHAGSMGGATNAAPPLAAVRGGTVALYVDPRAVGGSDLVRALGMIQSLAPSARTVLSTY